MGAITAEMVDTGEKRDARGRRVTPTERRAQVVQAFRVSELTMASFARRERLNYARFAGWVAKAQRGAVAKSPIQFAELWMPFATPSAGAPDQLEVRLPDGTALRGGRVADVNIRCNVNEVGRRETAVTDCAGRDKNGGGRQSARRRGTGLLRSNAVSVAAHGLVHRF